MSIYVDWAFIGIVTLVGCIFLYPVSRELGDSFRRLFAKGRKNE